MAFKFKSSESIEAGTQRILSEQCERAEQQLAGATASDSAAAVHEARKCLKRMRALLRLVRPAIGDERWRAASTRLRNVGLKLSPLRDSDVVRQTIAALTNDARPTLAKALADLADRLALRTTNSPEGDDRLQILAEAGAEIAAFRQSCEEFDIPGRFPDVIADGLRRGQAQGRARLHRVRAEASDEHLHELRKAVQVHWRHMLLLTAAWPDLMRARADEARALSVLLGDDQDLAMLERVSLEAVSEGFRKAAADRIAAACRKRRKALQKEALSRADRLFLEKPRRFAEQMARAWTISAHLKSEAREQQPDKTT